MGKGWIALICWAIVADGSALASTTGSTPKSEVVVQAQDSVLMAQNKRKRRKGKRGKKGKKPRREEAPQSREANKNRRFYRNTFSFRPLNFAHITQFKRMGMDLGGQFTSSNFVTEADTYSAKATATGFGAGGLFGMPMGPVILGGGFVYQSLSYDAVTEADNPADGTVYEINSVASISAMQVTSVVGMELTPSLALGLALPYINRSETTKTDDPTQDLAGTGEAQEQSGSLSYIRPHFGAFYYLGDMQLGFAYAASVNEEDKENGVSAKEASEILLHGRTFLGPIDLETYLKLLGESAKNGESEVYKDNQEIGFLGGMRFGGLSLLGLFAYETDAAASPETVSSDNLPTMTFGGGLRMGLGTLMIGADGQFKTASGSSETADHAVTSIELVGHARMAF